jgi:hypothetical protein
MKRTAIGTCIAAVLGFAVSISAQAPQTPPSPQTQRPMSSDRSSKDLNVTGCLSKTADGSFTLNNASITDPSSPTAGTTGTAGSATAGTTGTTPTAPGGSSSTSGSTYALSGSSSDLEKHVGHKIQVTGKEAPPSATGTSGSTSATASPTMSPSKKLDVSTVKMIAASCS